MPRRRHGGSDSGSESGSDRGSDSGSDPNSSTDPDAAGWLLDGLAIRPPLEEFRRLFEMKKRAFEGKVDADSLRKYEFARRLGEKFIADQDFDQDTGPGEASC
ncbi:MAG: hypothetical protein OSB09_02015 [Planctomycetota bacterium]|nr:hypothetical protein [Planctomycetota bacterium]